MKATYQQLLSQSTKRPSISWSHTLYVASHFVWATVPVTFYKTFNTISMKTLHQNHPPCVMKKSKISWFGYFSISVANYLCSRKDVKFSAHNFTVSRKKSLVAFHKTQLIFRRIFCEMLCRTNIFTEFDSSQCEHENIIYIIYKSIKFMWIGEIEIEIVFKWKFNSLIEKRKNVHKSRWLFTEKIIKGVLDLIYLLQQWIYRALQGIISHVVTFVLIASE